MTKIWIEIIALCVSITVVLSLDEHRPPNKRKSSSSSKDDEDDRSKRGLEYSFGHGGFIQNPRLERRISTLPQSAQPRYPPFFPSATNHLRKHPYAVSMEPLINYSARDPLYDTSALHLLPQPHNDLINNKHDDLLADHNHFAADTVYKQYIERPVYIKEPEPIIEIIIKEANTTQQYAPLQQPILVAKKKKEEVQVFYVKYKKNPHGVGKESVIYDKPIAAITPVNKDGYEAEDSNYELQHPADEAVTYRPAITTTIRAVIKPDSETYHADHGIRVTFNSEHNDHEVGHSLHNEQLVQSDESPPHPERELPLAQNFEKRQQLVHFAPPHFRQPQPYRPFNQPPNLPQTTNFQQQQQQQSQFQASKQPPQVNSPFQSGPFAEPPRQPVPYHPFEQIRNTPPTPFQFPKTQAQAQSHFALVTHPQVPSLNPPVVFNSQRINHNGGFINQNFNQVKVVKASLNQGPFQNQNFAPQQQHRLLQLQPMVVQTEMHQNHFVNPNFHQQQNENYQYFKQPTEVQHNNYFNVGLSTQQHLNHNYQQNRNVQIQPFQNLQQQQLNILPAGGELIHSLPKFEQHISIPPAPVHHPNKQEKDVNYNQNVVQQTYSNLQQQNQNNPGTLLINPNVYNKQIINQFSQVLNRDQAQSLKQTQTNANYQHSFGNGFKAFTTTASPIQQQNTAQPFITRNYFNNQQRTPFSTPKTSTTTTTTSKPETTTTDLKSLNIQLPDEVPDDLRQQLLSSGILKNADISILDYDKVGDIPLSALPPDQLANFYNAGGGQQLAAASRFQQQIVKPDGTSLTNEELEVLDDQSPGLNDVSLMMNQPTLKVVHYNPHLVKDLKNSYVKDGAVQVEPVVLNDKRYNRYLPLKVSGTQFPIPDVPQLKGKNINSVVVLAPIDYNFQRRRQAREANIKFVKNLVLKRLLKHPTKQNYNDWLRQENNTSSEKQSVILLVTGPINREIFMYDVATQSVSKLNGELSSAFVDAAESNTVNEEIQDSSNRVETRVPRPPNMSLVTDEVLVDDLTPAGSEYVDVKVPIIDPLDKDLEAAGSEQLERFVDSGGDELTASATKKQYVNVYINR